MGFTRRDLLKTTAGVTMGAMAPTLVRRASPGSGTELQA